MGDLWCLGFGFRGHGYLSLLKKFMKKGFENSHFSLSSEFKLEYEIGKSSKKLLTENNVRLP